MGSVGAHGSSLLSSSSSSASGHCSCSVLGCQERWHNKGLLWGSLRKPWHFLLKGLFGRIWLFSLRCSWNRNMMSILFQFAFWSIYKKIIVINIQKSSVERRREKLPKTFNTLVLRRGGYVKRKYLVRDSQQNRPIKRKIKPEMMHNLDSDTDKYSCKAAFWMKILFRYQMAEKVSYEFP